MITTEIHPQSHKMQLKNSPTESQHRRCDTSNQVPEPAEIKQHGIQSMTNDTDVKERTQPATDVSNEDRQGDALSPEKSPTEPSSKRRLRKISTCSRKAALSARGKKRCQFGTGSQVLPSMSKVGCESSETEPLEAAKMETSTVIQKISSESCHPTEKRLEDPRGPGSYFYIGGNNGAQLVSAYCLNKGWQRIQDNKRDDYKLKWCETKSPATYCAFRDGEQLLYQIPNNKVLTSKIGLLSSLREYERVMQKINKTRMLKMADFFPETFRLDAKEEAEVFFSTYEEGQTWICKPTGLNQGRGIYLLKNQEQINTLRCQMQSMADMTASRKVLSPAKCPQARIVQRYIPNPLLLEGKKFDIRSYLLIASTVPYFVFFRHGYVRLTCNTYDLKSDDLTGHLTNQYMQKKNPLYNELKEETVWGMERFNTYVNELFAPVKGLPQDWVLNVFTRRMQQIIIHSFLSVKSKLECRRGYFDLIGCDFLIDEDFKVWLLEMNCNPALHTNCEVLKEVIPSVVNETLDLALEIFNKSFKGQRIMPLNTQSGFVLLYNGENNEQTVKFNWPRSISPVKMDKTLPSESLNGPAKNVEKSHKSLRASKDSGSLIIAKPPISRSPQRATLAVSPVNMTGLYDGFTLRSVKHKSRNETTSKSFDVTQHNFVTEMGQTKGKIEQPSPVAKISFSGPQKFRVIANKKTQYTKRSSSCAPIYTIAVIGPSHKSQILNTGSSPGHKVSSEMNRPEDTQNIEQGYLKSLEEISSIEIL
ncbi:inactive polyglycylase TTLL10 isoform X2 [Pseudophryne corroboree]|uniref:inactive polyglycylase TTLL10 isoform X2 n=1 Tax=Pseudophryne corroboree TaxID=495146 RepID=UPI003081C790